jgi:AGCS family alanine or glycine:cation symporter
MTGLVLVNSGHWREGHQGAALTKAAFGDISLWGPLVLTVGLLTFVFSTILGWEYYGEKAAEYLFGPRAVAPYRWMWVAAVLLGSVSTLSAVWTFADIANGLMAVPNLVALLALSGVAAAETRSYFAAEAGRTQA